MMEKHLGKKKSSAGITGSGRTCVYREYRTRRKKYIGYTIYFQIIRRIKEDGYKMTFFRDSYGQALEINE